MDKNVSIAMTTWIWQTPAGEWEVYSLRPSVVPDVPLAWLRIPCKSGPEALSLKERMIEKMMQQAAH